MSRTTLSSGVFAAAAAKVSRASVQKTQLLINPRQEDEVHRVTTELRSESAASARRGNRQRHKRPARAGRGRRIA